MQDWGFSEALQCIQELKERVVKGNETLEQRRREKEEEERKGEARRAEKARRKAMKAREEEESRKAVRPTLDHAPALHGNRKIRYL
jgi:hypothetical protein